jgi:HEAT repeat protein
MHDGKTLPVLRRIARESTPSMRALAVLGLGMARDRGSIAQIAGIASSVDAGNVARAAAAYALGDLDAQAQVPVLLAMAEESDPLPRRMALVALARMAMANAREAPWEREAVQAMADAVFAGHDEGARGQETADAVRRAGVAGLAALALWSDRAHGARTDGASPPAPDRGRSQGDVLPVPETALDVDALLDGLVPREIAPADRAAALVRFAEPVQRSALAALRTSGARARAVLDALGSGEGELAPFVAKGAKGPEAEKARGITAALEPSIVPLARHPDPSMRTKAIVLVARSSSDAAVEAVVGGLEDSNESVQRVALAAVGAPRSDGGRVPASARAVTAVGKILAGHESWAMRVLAARAMGRLGAAGAGPEAARQLGEAATKDPYALVRQAALEALASFDASGARAVAARVAASDPEPRVRDAARAIAAGQPPGRE